MKAKTIQYPVPAPRFMAVSVAVIFAALLHSSPVQGAQVLFYNFEEGTGSATADQETGNAGNNAGTLTNGNCVMATGC